MSAPIFGIDVPAAVGADPVARAVQAEALGFDFVSVNDHLHGTNPRHETWTLLSWIAARTSRIRVASRVLGLPYRNVAVTAKMAETFARLSQGRLILGLGAGASDNEFRAFGVEPRKKVTGLEEGVRIIRGLWSQRSFSFDGVVHRVSAAEVEPKPDHVIPIWLGTFGPRALDVTGRVADGWIPSYDMAPPERATQMRDRIRAAAEAAGRDADDVACIYNIDIRVGDWDEPGVLSGSSAQIADALVGFGSLGFDGFNFFPVGEGRDEQIAALAEIAASIR